MSNLKTWSIAALILMSGLFAGNTAMGQNDSPLSPPIQKLPEPTVRSVRVRQKLLEMPPRVGTVAPRVIVRAEAPLGMIGDRVAAQRQSYIESLKQLQDAYCRSGQLDEAIAVRDMLRQVEAQAQAVSSLAPVNDSLDQTRQSEIESTASLSSLRGQNEQVFYRRVTGRSDGYLWGGENNLYTDDSDLATAAVHSGVLAPGTTAIVQVTILPGQSSYTAISRNDVQSRAWESWEGSFRIDGAGYEIDFGRELRGQAGPIPVFIKAEATGNVWGSSPYTDDSALGAAAVHAGLLQPGESGLLLLNPMPGQDSYSGSVRNGITSSDYHSFGGSLLLQKYAPSTKPLPPWKAPNPYDDRDVLDALPASQLSTPVRDLDISGKTVPAS